jgi:hypothetical protein
VWLRFVRRAYRKFGGRAKVEAQLGQSLTWKATGCRVMPAYMEKGRSPERSQQWVLAWQPGAQQLDLTQLHLIPRASAAQRRGRHALLASSA